MQFVKGHGTRNDFVVLPDLDDVHDLTVDEVVGLCDRRGGIGADGVLRLVRGGDRAPWFMDYRNADGSVAEMCGNGIRVLARYLVTSGLQPPGRFTIDTRGGVRTVEAAADGDISVEMGPATKTADAKVAVNGVWLPALGWSMGNPHLVAVLSPGDAVDVDGADLTQVPDVDPADAYPDGVNVELVTHVGPRHLRMRVHERGVGETQSCGTGACAAAAAVMATLSERTTYDVDVPGGRLRVTWRDDGEVVLAGPAVLVATGDYSAAR